MIGEGNEEESSTRRRQRKVKSRKDDDQWTENPGVQVFAEDEADADDWASSHHREIEATTPKNSSLNPPCPQD